MVGVPLYECIMPTSQGEFNQYNAISPPSEDDNEKDINGEEDEDKVSIVQCVECCQQDLTNEKRNNRLRAYEQAAVTPFDNDGATADAPLEMVSQPLPNDTSNVSIHNTTLCVYISVLFSIQINCNMNSDGYKLPMTDEEKPAYH